MAVQVIARRSLMRAHRRLPVPARLQDLSAGYGNETLLILAFYHAVEALGFTHFATASSPSLQSCAFF